MLEQVKLSPPFAIWHEPPVIATALAYSGSGTTLTEIVPEIRVPDADAYTYELAARAITAKMLATKIAFLLFPLTNSLDKGIVSQGSLD